MKSRKRHPNASYSKYLFGPSVVFNASIDSCLEETTLKPQFEYFDVSNIVSSFSKRIYSYDCENDVHTEIELSIMVNQGKGDLFELLLSKSDIKDITFFNKFISCYMFSEAEYDSEVVDFLLRYSLNSNDASLNQTGINLFTLSSHNNRLIYDKYKNTRFESEYLNRTFKQAVMANENVC